MYDTPMMLIHCLKRGTFSSISLVSIALVSVTTFYTCALTMMCLIAVWLKMTIHQVCVWSKQDFMNTIITTSMFIANLMTVIMVIKIIKMLIRMMTKTPFSFKMMWMMMTKIIIIMLSTLVFIENLFKKKGKVHKIYSRSPLYIVGLVHLLFLNHQSIHSKR